MKSILETSIYLLTAVLICFIGIDFVSMNIRVSKVNEIAQYMSDYIELYGTAQRNLDGEYVIDSDTMQAIEEKADNNYMKVECSYVSSTDDYIYYDMNITYVLAANVLGYKKSHVTTSLVRVAV